MDRPTLLPASLRWNLDYGFKSRRGGDELTANLQIMKQNRKTNYINSHFVVLRVHDKAVHP